MVNCRGDRAWDCIRMQVCERQRGQQHDSQTAPQPDHAATVAAACLCGNRNCRNEAARGVSRPSTLRNHLVTHYP